MVSWYLICVKSFSKSRIERRRLAFVIESNEYISIRSWFTNDQFQFLVETLSIVEYLDIYNQIKKTVHILWTNTIRLERIELSANRIYKNRAQRPLAGVCMCGGPEVYLAEDKATELFAECQYLPAYIRMRTCTSFFRLKTEYLTSWTMRIGLLILMWYHYTSKSKNDEWKKRCDKWPFTRIEHIPSPDEPRTLGFLETSNLLRHATITPRGLDIATPEGIEPPPPPCIGVDLLYAVSFYKSPCENWTRLILLVTQIPPPGGLETLYPKQGSDRSRTCLSEILARFQV